MKIIPLAVRLPRLSLLALGPPLALNPGLDIPDMFLSRKSDLLSMHEPAVPN